MKTKYRELLLAALFATGALASASLVALADPNPNSSEAHPNELTRYWSASDNFDSAASGSLAADQWFDDRVVSSAMEDAQFNRGETFEVSDDDVAQVVAGQNVVQPQDPQPLPAPALPENPICANRPKGQCFKALIGSTDSENFIWIEEVGTVGHISDAVAVYSCDFSRLKTPMGGAGHQEPLSEEQVKNQLGGFLERLKLQGLKFNPRWCESTDAIRPHLFPMEDIIHKTSSAKSIAVTVLRAVGDISLLALGDISTNFTWTKLVYWSAGIGAAKAASSFLGGDKPLPVLFAEAKVGKIPKLAKKWYEDWTRAPDNIPFVTVTTSIPYTLLDSSLREDLRKIYRHHCGGDVPKHEKARDPITHKVLKDPVTGHDLYQAGDDICEQWNHLTRRNFSEVIDLHAGSTEAVPADAKP